MEQKTTILLIEDEPGIADTVVYALQTEGYDVLWSDTAKKGLNRLSTESPQLVILDVGLPDRDGFEVCREIRNQSTIPIIILTARSEEIDRVVGLELGADDYVTKPFSPRELTARVKALLRRVGMSMAKENDETTGFQLDKRACEISYQGKVLDLSRYEYRILMLFLEHPRRVYSREQLMDLVWEEPENSFDRTVDTHIKTLRAKIAATSAGKDCIKTHRGLGYAFIGPTMNS